MSDEFANPGDTIISRNTTCEKGKRILVIEKPDDMPHASDDTPGCAWFRSFGGQAYFLRADKYTVVERAGKVHRMADEVVTEVNGVVVDVETSMKRRRDDIFRKMFRS